MQHCARYRDAISARFDGEDPGRPEPELDAHLKRCPACAAFAAALAIPTLGAGVRPEPAVDRTAAILAALGRADQEATSTSSALAGLRFALALLGVVAIGVAGVAMVAGDPSVPAHTSRHVAAFEIALGVGFLTAALRPRTAVGLLPLVATLGLLIVAGAVHDVASGAVGGGGEAQHVVEIAGVLVLWLIVREQRWRWARG